VRELKGKTALVTGASRGLGTHIAQALAAEGMNLVLAARSRDKLEVVAGAVRSSGVSATVVPTDVTDRDNLERLVRTAIDEFGSIDVLVNNAGVLVLYPFDRLAIEDMERALRLNLTAAMILTRLVIPGMLERGSGHIVNMSSIAGKWGPPCDQVYGATKAGLIAFSESLRNEYRGTGVSASVICPGYVEEAGMYHDGRRVTKTEAPRWVGRTWPRDVARAVVKAVKRDRPEIIVNTPPARLLTVITEISPAFGLWLLSSFDGFRPFTRGAAVNVELRGQLTGLTPDGRPAGSSEADR
jgi:short-subunit dehydrogenase